MRSWKIIIIWLRKIRSIYYTNKVALCVGVYHKPLRVNRKSIVTRNVLLGKNVNFNGMNIIGDGVVIIGDNFHSGTECMIITQTHNYEGEKIPYDSTYIYKDISIGDNVWFGSRVTVLNGVNIGEGAIIQAGSVVVSNIPDYAIAGGHPARVFNYRNINHYECLKLEGRFH